MTQPRRQLRLGGDRWCTEQGAPDAVVESYTVLRRVAPQCPFEDWRAGDYVDPADLSVLLHLSDRTTVCGFNYRRGQLSFTDELLGMTLTDARQLFRDRDVAYVQQLLNTP